MASKTSFSPDEWTKLLQGVMTAGIAVTAADPSGLWGTVKESMTAGQALLEAKTDTGSSQLIKAVVADFETAEGRAAAGEPAAASRGEHDLLCGGRDPRSAWSCRWLRLRSPTGRS